jgi:hypothetical protein
MLRTLTGACALLLASGCATTTTRPDAVPARQGGYLTRPDMAWDAGLVEEAGIRSQTFVAKEAASGGPNLGHGGCGCN